MEEERQALCEAGDDKKAECEDDDKKDSREVAGCVGVMMSTFSYSSRANCEMKAFIVYLS